MDMELGKTATEAIVDKKIEEQTNTDGARRWWYENGKVRHEELPDGTERNWYNNEQMFNEYLPDGTYHEWHDNGQMRFEIQPNTTEYSGSLHDNEQGEYDRIRAIDEGVVIDHELEQIPTGSTVHRWYENGTMSYEKLPDGTKREWYGNGKPASEELPNGTKREWHENGTLSCEVLPDGSEHRWHSDGTLRFEKLNGIMVYNDMVCDLNEIECGERKDDYLDLPDGSLRWVGEYDENDVYKELADGTMCWYDKDTGETKDERMPDGTVRGYYHGKLEYEQLNNGTMRWWDINGCKRREVLHDGTKYSWHGNGQLEFEKLPDGTSTRYNKAGEIIYHETKGVEDTNTYLNLQRVKNKKAEQLKASEDNSKPQKADTKAASHNSNNAVLTAATQKVQRDV